MAYNFEFYAPTKVIFGKGAENKTGKLIKAFGASRVLVVYGGGSVKRSGLLEKIEASLSAEKIVFRELGGVVPNPRLDKVYEGIRMGKEWRTDFLLAVGGGSVIDSAKAIAYGLAKPKHDVWELFAHTRTTRKCLPVASVLTIAAAGNELGGMFDVTHGAGLAAIWPSWARYVCKECLPRFVRYARNVMGIAAEGSDEEIAEAGIRALEEFYHSIGMPVNLEELGIHPTDRQIEEMAERCMAACGSHTGSAKKLAKDDMIRIYTNARNSK